MNEYGTTTTTTTTSNSINNTDSNVVVQNNANTELPAESESSVTYTSTTAPGIVFTSRNELAIHYKSDWHKYNLKRREANLPVLLYNDFIIRYNAALAVKSAQEQYNNTKNRKNNGTNNTGTDHIKKNTKKDEKKIKNKNNKKIPSDNNKNNGSYIVSQVSAYDKIKTNNEFVVEEQKQQQEQEMMVVDDCETTDANCKAIEIEQHHQDPAVDDVIMVATTTTTSTADDDKAEIDSAVIEAETTYNTTNNDDEDNSTTINPCQCLFDNTIHDSVTKNIQYMYKKYSFYIPDNEYIIDTKGFIGYCHEKIILGHTCLYCQRVFSTVQACKQHMIDVQHTKILYEPTIDLDEYTIFYDFTIPDNEFIQSTTKSKLQTNTSTMLIEDVKEDDNDNDDDEEWEDEDDNEDDGNDIDIDIDDEFLDDYETTIQKTTATLGWDVTPLGEIIFPDGRIIGHRALRRYYKQKPQLRNKNDEYKSDAVQAALLGCRERLYRGNVYTIGGGNTTDNSGSSTSLEVARQQSNNSINSYKLTKALFQHNNIKSTTVTGRNGNGILVSTNKGTNGSIPYYTQLSVYRYRAALSKQHKMEHKIRTIQQKQSLNMNHMDKKHNRIMNGVSVQHAKR